MRKLCLVLGLCMLCGCSAGVVESTEINESVEESTITEQSDVVVTDITDTAFGVPCRYVDGEQEMGVLKCRQKEVRPEWKTPADGWELKIDGDFKVIHQVYDEDDVLLLPMDYGSNTHKIVGLDGVEETECEPCTESE